MTGIQLLVLAKAPVPGRVKTRLCPPYQPDEAAQLAAAALADTLEAVGSTPALRRVLVLDGELDQVPATFSVVDQVAGGLATRIVAAIRTTALEGASTVLVGMDTPQLTVGLLDDIGRRLHAPGVDAVLGPCDDGGWWCLGLRDPRHADLLASVPMSTAQTAELTRAVLAAHGLRVADAPALRDVDTAADAADVAAAAPATRFARTFAALARSRSGPPRRTTAAELYAEGIRAATSKRRPGLMLRDGHGRREPLRLEAWSSDHIPGDDGLLARCTGPTLDVGCGPGRLTAALGTRGVPALGVDVVAAAVASTQRRGALAVRRSLYDRLPGEGRWASVLLADGNVGIGGNPDRVLARCAALLAGGSTVLVEVEPRGGLERRRVRLENGHRYSEWFSWAFVGREAVDALAARSGLAIRESWKEHGRCFVALAQS